MNTVKFGRRTPAAGGFRRRGSVPPPSVLSAQIERLYIACVSFALGVAGTAIGFTLGVVPYFRAQLDFSQYDWFFVTCVGIGTLVGAIIGAAFGPRWYRATEANPIVQRRLLSYLKRRQDTRVTAQRTIGTISLQSLLGKRTPEAS